MLTDNAPKRAAKKKRVVKAPAGDIASSGGDYGKKQADAYKKTKAYRGAVRAGYKGNQDREQVRADTERTAHKGAATAEQQVVARTHADAVRGNRENARSRAGKDTKGADERRRALSFLAEHPEILKPKKKDDDGGVGGAISDVFHKVYGGGDEGDGKGGAVATARNPTLSGAAGGGLYAVPRNVGLVLGSDPKKQVPLLAKDTAESVAAIPAGIVAMALHPEKTLKATGADYARRYGALAKGDQAAFRKRMQEEGVAPEVFDIATGASGAAGGAGRIAQVAAKGGKLGKTAERIATERPAMRVSGNVSKEQLIHENLGRNVVSAGRDAARRKVQTRRAGQENASLEVRQAQVLGEVTHVRKRRQRNEQQKMVAGSKGRRLTQLKAEGQREEAAARKNVHSLSKPERRALNYAMKFGIHDAETARREIPQWLERVKAERVKHAEETGREIPDKQNEIPDLEWLLENADEAFTPATARVAQEEGARAARVGGEDPGFDNSVADRRRHMAQAEFTGEARPLSKAEATTSVREAKSAVRKAEVALSAAADTVHRDTRTAARSQGRAEVFAALADTKGRRQQAVQAAEAALDDARAAVRRATEIKTDGGYLVKGHDAPVTAAELEAVHLPRIVDAAHERGLQEPHYTPSEKRPMGGFSAFAVGGKKAVVASKRYEGSLLRTGRENTNPEAHILSIQKGIKRKHNWNLVADTFEEHAAGEAALRHQTLDDLRDELERRGVDPDTVAFWNPGRYKAERQHVDRSSGGGDADITDPTFESRNVQDALSESTLDDLDSASSQFAGTNGWSVIPRAVYDEIHADVQPSGKVGRTYDVARGKVSRLLLGNPAWLQFQVASNGLMTGLAGVGPVDAIKAQRWWKSLSTAERDAIEPYVGVHAWYDDQRHLGAAANSRMVNAYRAFKTTSFYRVAHKGNPLDALFKADNTQNNFFRKAVFYNRVKREAYQNMGREATKAIAAQRRIVDTMMARAPDDAMRALLKDGRQIEKHAQAVNDFLGNWSTYTARERRLFSRSVMFYGFMRFSVKLAFYTMPVEHPLLSSILLHLGHLQNEELEKLFGGNMPIWEIGSYYDHGRKFNAARLNPFFNALQYEGPGQLVGNLGPLANVIINQAAGKNVAFDKLFTVDGSTKYIQKGKDLSLSNRLHLAAAELEKVSPYLRMAERYTMKNRQTSDSWLLHPRDTGKPGLGEKSHELGDVLREGLAPIATEDGRPALRAAEEMSSSDLPSTEDIISGKAKLPALPKLPPLPKTITIQVK
jgi:hypothetical protein